MKMTHHDDPQTNADPQAHSCPLCHALPTIREVSGWYWEAVCYGCYDGAPDAGATAQLAGWGFTRAAAIADWNWQVEDTASELA